MRKFNLINQKFNRLIVIEASDPIGIRKRSSWKCQCDCGNICIVKTDELKSGDTKSCGCLNNEKRSILAQLRFANVIH